MKAHLQRAGTVVETVVDRVKGLFNIAQNRIKLQQRPECLVIGPRALLFQGRFHFGNVREDDVAAHGVILMNTGVITVQVTHVVNGVTKIHGFRHLFGRKHLHIGVFAQSKVSGLGAHHAGGRIKALRRNGLVVFPKRAIRLPPHG